jgi:competence protein ComEA
MNVTVNQRILLIVIFAMVFVLALVKGVMQSAEVDELTSTKLQLSDNQPASVVSDSKDHSMVSASNQLVFINSASAEELAENLEGIGNAIAERIVTRRQQQGPYQNYEQLKSVSGVGMAKIEANRGKISFE